MPTETLFIKATGLVGSDPMADRNNIGIKIHVTYKGDDWRTLVEKEFREAIAQLEEKIGGH